MAMQTLIEAADKFGLKLGPRSTELAEVVCAADCWTVERFESPAVFEAIKTLWEQDPVIKECYDRR